MKTLGVEYFPGAPLWRVLYFLKSKFLFKFMADLI